MTKVLNITLAGVGGQGTLLAGEILCNVALLSGRDVKKSEVHGMAQRGGSVVSQVRIGQKVNSPLIALGETDILIAFEKLEALRYLDYLKPEASIIVNEEEIYPPSVNLGDAKYPDRIGETIRRHFRTVKMVDGPGIASAAGNIRAVNTALLGVLSNFLNIESGIWEKVLRESFPEKALKANLKAFQMGRAA